MEVKPLFDEKDLISEWKNYKWLASGFMQMTFKGFYAAFSANDHLIWMMMSEENQNIPSEITALSSRIFNNPEKKELIQQKKSLEARLSNIEAAEEAITNAMNEARVTLNRILHEHRNNLMAYAHRAKQEIDHLDAYGNLGMIQRVVYPEALELYNQMEVFLQKLEELRIMKLDNYEGYREQTYVDFNLMGLTFLQNIVATYGPEEKAIEKIEEPDNLNLDGLDLKTQKEQILLLYQLGVIEFLREKYPILKQSNNQLAKIIAVVLKHPQTSLQPTINALMTNNSMDKNYPKNSAKVTAIMNQLNAGKSI